MTNFVDSLTFDKVKNFFEEHGITGQIIFFPIRCFDVQKRKIPEYREYIVKTPPNVRTFIILDSQIYEKDNKDFEINNEEWQAFMYKCFGEEYKFSCLEKK